MPHPQEAPLCIFFKLIHQDFNCQTSRCYLPMTPKSIFPTQTSLDTQIWVSNCLCNNLCLDVSKTSQNQQAHCSSSQPSPFILPCMGSIRICLFPPHPHNQYFTKSYQFYFPSIFLIHLCVLHYYLAKLQRRPPNKTPHFYSCPQIPL